MIEPMASTAMVRPRRSLHAIGERRLGIEIRHQVLAQDDLHHRPVGGIGDREQPLPVRGGAGLHRGRGEREIGAAGDHRVGRAGPAIDKRLEPQAVLGEEPHVLGHIGGRKGERHVGIGERGVFERLLRLCHGSAAKPCGDGNKSIDCFITILTGGWMRDRGRYGRRLQSACDRRLLSPGCPGGSCREL